MEQVVEGTTNLKRTSTENEEQFASLRQVIAERDEQIANLNLTVSEIQHSTSWKLTVPVRFVGNQLLCIRLILRALQYARAEHGGYWSLINHVLSTYKKEGFRGIKLWVAFLVEDSSAPTLIIDHTKSNLNEVEGSNLNDIEEHSINDYAEWISRYDTITDIDREKIKVLISQLAKEPLISIIMPVYNPPIEMLKEAIQSVQNQLYFNWELCIADDASTNKRVHKLLKRFADKDSRIKVVFRKQNGHISVASNSALKLVSGDYIALLDNDDLLPEHALFWVAQTIIDCPDAGLIYSDEDKIDQSCKRYDPYFKSDWNPEFDSFSQHDLPPCRLSG